MNAQDITKLYEAAADAARYGDCDEAKKFYRKGF